MRRWGIQFAGGILLIFAVWAFLNTPDQQAWQVGLSALLAVMSIAGTVWLIAKNFGRSFLASGACLVALLVLLWLTGLLSDHVWDIATPTASWLSLERKKPVLLASVAQWIGWVVFILRWFAAPLLVAPVALRLRFRRFALWYCALFPFGLIAPHYLAHWVPKVSGLWPELLSALARFGIGYALLISAWVWLGRAGRGEAPMQSSPAPPVPLATQ